jgi:selenocysteine-specific elongation factor
VRIWVDRAFSITGSGTVVTGTLPAGTVRRGDELALTPAMRPVRVRALQSLGDTAAELTGVARAALNLRGIDLADVRRGMALIQPGRWVIARQVDVRLGHHQDDGLPATMTLHVGSARTPAKVRMLGSGHARLTLRDPVPLHVADRVLLRDPGAAASQDAPGAVTAPWRGITGAVVLDLNPPPLTRRGAAAAATAELASWPESPTAANLLMRRGLARSADLAAMGMTGLPPPVAAGWLADPAHWASLAVRLTSLVAEYAEREPLAPGLPAEAAREALRLPDRRLVPALAQAAKSVTITGGLLTAASAQTGLPPALASAVAALIAYLDERPFDAPDAARLTELGLDRRDLAAAARHGALLRISDQIVLAPGADARAAEILAGLDQPFTAADARAALGSTRRTAIPLLEYLDRQRITQRLPDDRRRMR